LLVSPSVSKVSECHRTHEINILGRNIDSSVSTRFNELRALLLVEIEGCARCGGKLGIIASIEEPQIIALILGRIAPAGPV
jgi:hypothetical protein